MEKIEFKEPFTFEGQEYTGLELDLKGLTGADLLQAERDLAASGGFAGVPETSKEYLALVAAKAAKEPVELIKALPANEFSRVTVKVQNFLLS